ncbi:MAG: DNA cytosine methyltransferase, partial [Candidatus Nanoarchaeia archaeon]|nr:DNA cytosine methyltransferase [Candidatus Nanoarchaeia archaeon]
MKRQLRVIDIFCGAGGFSEGFREAGYKIIAGIDIDEEALKTFSRNFPEAVTLKKDLSCQLKDLDAEFKKILIQKIDVIIGGPPCQGFSIAGKRLLDDPRNTLYRAYFFLIKKLKPVAIVIENVPTIRSLFEGIVAKQIKEDFEGLDYRMEVFTLNAADYGVPQNRRRTFFVGVKSEKNFKIPAPTTAFSFITSEMAISDLPLLDDCSGGEEVAYNTNPKNQYQKEM